jgi:hypothetical protein
MGVTGGNGGPGGRRAGAGRKAGKIETVRLRDDRSHAEVVALLFSVGDHIAGERYLKRAAGLLARG